MPRAISKCPQCGSTVTPYAAGCAVCGADIAGARRALEERRQRPLGKVGAVSVPRFQLGDDGLRIVISLLLAIAAPMIGVLAASYFAWQVHNEGRNGVRNVLLVIAGLCAVTLSTGFWLYRYF